MSLARKLWRACLICLTFTLCSSSAFALDPNQPLAQLYHTSWSAKQGVTGNVTALAQTTDGYLWVGTTDGLLRFDGISFERYQPENGSLPATSVSALLAVPDGGLWVGFVRGGASFISNGRVRNYSDSDGFPVSKVRCFARDPSGTIWAAVVGGFARLEGERWKRTYSDWNYPARTAWALLVDREGTLWVATGSRIVFLPKGTKRFESTDIQAGNVYTLTQAPNGEIVFSDEKLQKTRAFRYDAGIKVLPDDIDIYAVSSLFDRDGALWLGGDGLMRIPFPDKVTSHKQGVEKFTEAEGLTNNGVADILEDREGNIWVATDGGLDRFRHRNVAWFPLRGGLFSLVAGSGGDVWAGSRGAVPVVRVQDRKLLAGAPTNVYAVYRDPDGSIWYGGGNSVVHWENGRFVDVGVPHQVLQVSLSANPPDPIVASSITRDRSGNLWVAFGGSGEFRFKDGAWNFVQILPDHPDWAANYAFTDSADRVWLCWGDRIARYDRGKIQILGAKDGLAIGPPNVVAEGDQHIWVGGESGLSVLQDGQFHTIHSAGGREFASLTGIVVTQNGGMWLSTSSGIVHIPQSEIEQVIQHPEYKASFELFDLVSDLPEPTQEGEVYSSKAIQASDGTIWFATETGAIRVDPAHIYRNPVPPPVSIRSVVADDKSYSPFSNPALPALTKNLRIDYAGLSLSIPERVRFRYKLDGRDRDWQDVGTRRQAFYGDLPPGDYHFHVIACNDNGIWNEAGATLDFSVAPAYFQTIWFRSLWVVAFLGLLWAIYQLRLHQVHRQFHVGLEARVSERTRIARELHDTLLQSFHGLMFQFQAARNMLPQKIERAMQLLDDAILATEHALAESRHAIQHLRSEDSAENDLGRWLTVAGQELARTQETNGDSPFFGLTVEGERRILSSVPQDEIYRITREILRNAFQHAHASRIEAEIRYGSRELRVRIRDDGKGIDPHVLQAGGSAGHWGLRGVRERAKQIGARLDFWSQAGAGTEVELTVPAAIAYQPHANSRRFRLFRKAESDERGS